MMVETTAVGELRVRHQKSLECKQVSDIVLSSLLFILDFGNERNQYKRVRTVSIQEDKIVCR